jgi:hypothetical protein
LSETMNVEEEEEEAEGWNRAPADAAVQLMGP